MMKTITWADHEPWLVDFLEPNDGEAEPKPLMVCFDDGVADRIVDSRRERHDEGVDPVTELAVIAAELRPEACVIALPVRVKDIQEPDAPTLSRTWTLTCAVFHTDRVDLRARQLPVGGIGAVSDLDVELSPVASVLDDAVRHRLGEDRDHVLLAATRWGHTLYAPRSVDDADDAEMEVTVVSGSVHAGDAARHRLQRHAADLAARHRPTGTWAEVFNRPAVHADTPDGWVPACVL